MSEFEKENNNGAVVEGGGNDPTELGIVTEEINDEPKPMSAETQTVPGASVPTPAATDTSVLGEETAPRDVYFNGEATPDGTGYSTPDGGHGYAYAPADKGKNKKNGKPISRPLAVAAIVIGILGLAVGIFFGTIFFLDKVYGLDALPNNQGDFGHSSGGLVIEGESDSTGEVDVQNPSGNTGVGLLGKEEILPPENATISKSEPLRKDEDGDGKADYAYDANGQVLTSAEGSVYSAATVVSKVADSVVEIITEQVTSNWYGQYVTSGAGSGVIISPEGYIVTNHHVVEGANSITVRLTDGSEHKATLVGTDARTDVAVIWIDPQNRDLTVATLGASFDLVVGEEVLAIGNPLGSLGGTVTYGKISATARTITVENVRMTLLQVDAPINPGNSGGALFNMAGQLVGIVNAKMSSSGIEGLGFAIPIDTAYGVIVDLIDHGYVTGRPALGMTLKTMQNRYTGQYYVAVAESPYNDDVKVDDIIVKIGDTEVSSFSDVTSALSAYNVGDQVEMTLYRATQMVTVTVTLREYIPF